MKEPCNYTVDDAVLQVFAASTKRRRDELLRIFDFLARNPHIERDAEQRDCTGRQCCVKRFGPWTVIYWPEILVNQVHIVHVERLC